MSEQNRPFSTFREFIRSLNHATLEKTRDLAGSKVSSSDKFDEMMHHVASLYEGVEVPHSFADENGQIFDCVPIEQQPALRRGGTREAAIPTSLPGYSSRSANQGADLACTPQIRHDRKDAYGNTMSCPPGTIPLRRVTMEELGRFESLEGFFRKSPLGPGRHPRLSTPRAAAVAHKYAHAYQVVDNLGGHSLLNIWQPSVVGPDQVFSLAQHWYAGGSGAGLQTVEVGWQVYPQKYGNNKPTLFIYWTADGYNSTGCYNLDCSAFVQTNPSYTIGGAFSPVSTTGGTQYAMDVSFFFNQNNWWLYLNGGDVSNAVGYYPASIFNGGQLATCAKDIDYGGETVATSNWPPMGSGAFASSGWQNAAYQSNITYFPTAGGQLNASLTRSQPSPSCYTLELATAPAPWNTYFFFGGPGGTSC